MLVYKIWILINLEIGFKVRKISLKFSVTPHIWENKSYISLTYPIYKSRALNFPFMKLEFNIKYDTYLNKLPFKYHISILGGWSVWGHAYCQSQPKSKLSWAEVAVLWQISPNHHLKPNTHWGSSGAIFEQYLAFSYVENILNHSPT